jgi:hypothetical protein
VQWKQSRNRLRRKKTWCTKSADRFESTYHSNTLTSSPFTAFSTTIKMYTSWWNMQLEANFINDWNSVTECHKSRWCQLWETPWMGWKWFTRWVIFIEIWSRRTWYSNS